MVTNGSSHGVSTSAQDRFLVLSTRRNRWTTTPQLAKDIVAVSGRISRQIVYGHLAGTRLYARRLVWCVSLNTGYCGTENVSCGHHKIGARVQR
ncbi:hypothetical protein TNCV_1165081 [Trichonephila clavipes]|nr:hypothetical protein TNCV_1165081 [Trichonephila clavipes]